MLRGRAVGILILVVLAFACVVAAILSAALFDRPARPDRRFRAASRMRVTGGVIASPRRLRFDGARGKENQWSAKNT
jgi:hypothetical protein